jgi:CheY-like chemotaxis protein
MVNFGDVRTPAPRDNGAMKQRTTDDLIYLDRRARDQAADGDVPAVRVLLADGEKLVRAGLHGLLEEGGDIAVAGEAASGREAVALASEIRPDVVLMNARLPDLDGLEATRRIIADPELSQVGVLILGKAEHAEDLFGALAAGASGFLTRDTEPDELLLAVRVLAGARDRAKLVALSYQTGFAQPPRDRGPGGADRLRARAIAGWRSAQRRVGLRARSTTAVTEDVDDHSD